MELIDHIKDLDIDFAFDMICFHNFNCWNMGMKMTVEENRKAFEYLKKKILKSKLK